MCVVDNNSVSYALSMYASLASDPCSGVNGSCRQPNSQIHAARFKTEGCSEECVMPTSLALPPVRTFSDPLMNLPLLPLLPLQCALPPFDITSQTPLGPAPFPALRPHPRYS